MHPRDEARILREVLQQTEEPDAALAQQHKVRRAMYTIGSVGLLMALLLAFGNYGPSWLAVVVAAVAGFAAGAAVLHEQILNRWPVTVQYLDLDRVRVRLQALERSTGVNDR